MPEFSRIVTIVQARMSSDRLPGKAMMRINGTPMLAHTLERAKASGYPVWLAIPDGPGDGVLGELAEDMGCRVYRGSPDDVLHRMVSAAELAEADVVIRVTGDCPLWAPDVGCRVVEGHRPACYSSNDTRVSGYPDGLDVEVVDVADLRWADRHAIDREDREHVMPVVRSNRPRVLLTARHDEAVYSRIKLSVDTMEDLDRVRAIALYLDDSDYSWPATMRAIKRLRVATTGIHDTVGGTNEYLRGC